MSDADLSGLDEMIAALNALPRFGQSVLPAVADVLLRRMEANVAAQRGPDGTPWAPGRSGQGKVLAGAMGAVRWSASGKTLVFTIDGPEARHHLGAIKGAGSIALGKGGKRRDRRHQKGEREAMAKRTGEAFTPGRMEAYARPILPSGGATALLQRALTEAVNRKLPSVWRRDA